ncbi:MAG: GTPase HflX [Gammaproteobacteria bacterium]|nr:GTPase HflX [Gammaproteobacteria bacterium]
MDLRGTGRGQDQAAELAELRELARSAGVIPVTAIGGTRKKPSPQYYVGSGKAEEIRAAVEREQAVVAVFNHELSPSQERNLQRLLNCRVLDRTGLILEIFARRAQTHEGKLQVELAQLQHISTRLVRGWTHLERQKGGIGLRGGPGETQLESDRRLIAGRIKQVQKHLDKVQQQRAQGRKRRSKAALPTLSLVGYTNAGKSTLFNTLTGAKIYAANQLFATLDPTMRRIELPGGAPAVLADTVGFIRDLPHGLVAAFRATLEETRLASLLLHVVDASDPQHQERREQVNQVLQEIGARDIPQIEVYNKIDLVENGAPRLERNHDGSVKRVWVSAANGAGLDLLRLALAEHAAGQRNTNQYEHAINGLEEQQLAEAL